MTQEEKAKAYDEALEKAKKIMDSERNLIIKKHALVTIFPQLAESEDERIRKEIKQFILDTIGEISLDDKENAWLEWLEKQKYDRMKPIYDARESFESALAKAWKEYNDSGSRTVDGCEDNYTECAHAKGFREGYLFGIEKQKEAGIRWFKSDNVKNPDKPYIDKAGMFYTTDGRMCYASEIEKQKEQKSAEWSKEDEVRLKEAIEALNESTKDYLNSVRLSFLYDHLKELM